MIGRSKAKSLTSEEITGLIGEGNSVEGELKFEGTFRIDGTFTGRIFSDSTLVVGETGRIDAEVVDVHSMLMSGEVRGNVKVRERLELLSTARFSGNLSMGTNQLVIAEGAQFEGSVEMGPDQLSDKVTPLEPKKEAGKKS